MFVCVCIFCINNVYNKYNNLNLIILMYFMLYITSITTTIIIFYTLNFAINYWRTKFTIITITSIAVF